MSLDEIDEQKTYDLIAKLIAQNPRPNERKRICRQIVKLCASIAKWDVEWLE